MPSATWGVIEAVRCLLSYLWVRIRPPKDQTNFEGWVASRFGWRLYRTFFKTYTEKVWGLPGTELQADWAAQRIKNLSLLRAVVNSLMPRRKQTDVTSLIEEFEYPRYGPGMMWERCAELVEEQGSDVHLSHPVRRIGHADGRAFEVEAQGPHGPVVLEATDVISSMPLPHLVRAMDPPVPDDVRAAAAGLGFRDFLTVALVVPREDGFPDNWIYVHAPDVEVGRIQNFGQWSPHLVKDGRTCLGLEYFVTEGDHLWTADDADLVELGKAEMASLGLLEPSRVEAGYVVRMPKAYPMYDAHYQDNVDRIRDWLAKHAANVYPVGRNGMHRYNNQDHSMFTAMLTVENVLAADHENWHDVWQVNVEEDYHEEIR